MKTHPGSPLEGYVPRVVDTVLDELFPHLPAILLDGPKAVGKTATAGRRAATIHDLGAIGPQPAALALLRRGGAGVQGGAEPAPG